MYDYKYLATQYSHPARMSKVFDKLLSDPQRQKNILKAEYILRKYLQQESPMTRTKKVQGFAAISKERLQEIASIGGKAAHAQGKAHQWSHDEAVEHGRKGGLKISQNKEHMSRIGRLSHIYKSKVKVFVDEVEKTFNS